jgi:hypothetical protein
MAEMGNRFWTNKSQQRIPYLTARTEKSKAGAKGSESFCTGKLGRNVYLPVAKHSRRFFIGA